MSGRYSPENPVALGVPAPAVNMEPHSPVSSLVVGDNSDLMKQVATLWVRPDDVVVDCTYGRGVFWKALPGFPTFGHDLAGDGTDLRNLPHGDATVDVVVLDPPYRPTHGSKSFQGHALANAYGLGGESLDTIKDVIALYAAGVAEAARVLRPGGRLLCKTQDMTYGHRLHLVSMDVLRLMTEAGLGMADQFILGNKTQLSSPKWKRQERARRSHSVLWVGVKK